MDTSGSAPRERGNEQVQIRELGGPDDSGAGYYSPENDDAVPDRRRSRPFLPAWLLTGAMLAVGFLWLAGAFESVMYGPSYAGGMYSDGNTVPEEPPLAVQLRNLAQMSQLLLLLGTMSAAALLIVQGALKSSSRSAGGGRG